jgi:hypothetical protein
MVGEGEADRPVRSVDGPMNERRQGPLPKDLGHRTSDRLLSGMALGVRGPGRGVA